jgi:chaperonin GroES
VATKKASSKKSQAKIITKKNIKKSAKKSAPAKKVKTSKKASPKKQIAKTKKAAVKKSAKSSTRNTASAKSETKNKKLTSHSSLNDTKKAKLDLSNFVTPLDDRLLVQISGAEKMTPGGLYIPDTVADVSGNLEGFVVAAGRGHVNKKGHLCPLDVKVGDRIVFSEFAGTKVKIQNLDLLILRESEVMGVVSK